MNLVLTRIKLLDTCTIGKLTCDKYVWFTLEDRVRPTGEKVYGETAIPAGKYKVVIDHSDHFGKLMPHLLNVPGFEGIRIHSGNSSKDTEGCILLGKEWAGGDWIGKSKDAYNELFEAIKYDSNATITILDCHPENLRLGW